MSTFVSGHWRRFVLVWGLLTAIAALFVRHASASPTVKKVEGTVNAVVTSGSECSSPVSLCASGEFKGGIKGHFEFVAQSIGPSGTASLTVVNSTSVVHTERGDLFFASSAVGELTQGSDGEFTSLDLITGGTGRWAGASGYLQGRGFVVGTTDAADYRGKIVLP